MQLRTKHKQSNPQLQWPTILWPCHQKLAGKMIRGGRVYVKREAVGEAEGAEEAEALVLGARAAVPDDDGAPHGAAAPVPPAKISGAPPAPARPAAPSAASPKMGGGGGEEAAMAPRLLGFWELCRREADGSARRSGARSHVNRREPVLRNKFAFALLFFSLSLFPTSSIFSLHSTTLERCPAGGRSGGDGESGERRRPPPPWGVRWARWWAESCVRFPNQAGPLWGAKPLIWALDSVSSESRAFGDVNFTLQLRLWLNEMWSNVDRCLDLKH